eukprot:TRINITY_DN15004_c0_g1_i1.p2 TRINITY_DN15004_c0_g1~~TRINITY_DN15004_c0_g1_i1.p2  ORF type:complete len:103 (-),score=7.65 TRINITY_DN15004_c0_g1_i1:12-320(-)
MIHWVLISWICLNVNGGLVQHEHDALMLFFNDSSTKSFFTNPDDPCQWPGLICSSTKPNVLQINWKLSPMLRSIPDAISELSMLSQLILSGLNLTGTVPTSL